MLTDPISDMLTRIRNAVMARHDRVTLPGSRLKREVAKILVSEGYVASVTNDPGDDGREHITLVLKYGRDRLPAIEGLRRVSRPGRRVYVACEGHPQGPPGPRDLGAEHVARVMSDREARKHGVGGELLCEVW
jgi:small subunit ribosomal protein S8